MKTLELFNAVERKKPSDVGGVPFHVDLENGLIIEAGAAWAKDQISDFYSKARLNGEDLNKTFHKSWQKILESTRLELALEQIRHYLSTYGTDFEGEVYIPDEVLDLEGLGLKFKVIKSYTKKELKEKCLGLFSSGVALKKETISIVFDILDDLKYIFTGKEEIRNKEATVVLADRYGVFPKDPVEALRYCVYKSTGDTLLIKSPQAQQAIAGGSFNPREVFNEVGLDRMAEVFNRFKPLFLSYKRHCGTQINKISKLSKEKHKPLPANPLSLVTTRKLTAKDTKTLNRATVYQIFKALNACWTRLSGQDTFCYQVRNGKSFFKKEEDTNTRVNTKVCSHNFEVLSKYLAERVDLSDTSFYLPEGVEYALPTSEKMYVGNIPVGTKFTGKNMAVGVYWEDKWGANDIDLSGLNISGKVGWNSDYRQSDCLMYSGDITSAPKGAVEYMRATPEVEDTLIMTNIFSGDNDCGYKIVIGLSDRVTRDYMMNPENLLLDVRTNSVQNQTVQGLIYGNPEDSTTTFVLMNMGFGHLRVSSGNNAALAREALVQQYKKSLTLNALFDIMGVNVVDTPEESDVDLSLDSLERDTFINMFS